MDMNSTPAVELKHITKRFAKVLANDDVSITINKGEVVALLGENGAGKSTIMKILYGLYHATSGEILIDGKKEKITSSEDAVKLGISMIQQKKNLEKMDKSLPVLFVAGGDDPVGNYGEGVKQAGEKFRKIGMQDVSVRLFPLARHEILNEINREEIYNFVSDWICKKVEI